MHMIVDHGDEFTVYLFSPMRIPFFYGAFYLWKLFELTLIPRFLRKMGWCKIIPNKGYWGYNFPGLWGMSMTFDKRTCGTVTVNGQRVFGPPLTNEQKIRREARNRRFMRAMMWKAHHDATY